MNDLQLVTIEHYGDTSVGIPGDYAELRLDISWMDREDKDWLRERLEKALTEIWGFPAYAIFHKDYAAMSAAMPDCVEAEE